MSVARTAIAFTALLVPLSGCTSDRNPLDGTEWVLVEMGTDGDLHAVPADKEITLEFVSGEDTVTGSLVRNIYYASYQADGSQLTIGQPGGAEMWCEPPEYMELEHNYLDALRKAEWYVVEEDRLTIDCGVILLVYERR